MLFVLMQLLLNGSMVEAFHAGVERGPMPLDGGATMHAVGGAAIFALMARRLAMRLRHGAPPPPEDEPRPVQYFARGTHWAFYVVLLAMPLVLFLAVVTPQPWLGTLHAWTAWPLLLLIAMHIAGAVWHMVKPGSTAWRRMLLRVPAHETGTGA